MSKRVIAVLVGTLLALVGAVLWVPKSYWYRCAVDRLTPAQVRQAIENDDPSTAMAPQDPDRRARWAKGEWVRIEGDDNPSTWHWVWSAWNHSSDEYDIAVRTDWMPAALQPLVVLLLGGALLSWAIRDDRRRRARST